MKARDRLKAAGQREGPMLQIALTPAAVALQVFESGKRKYFELKGTALTFPSTTSLKVTG